MSSVLANISSSCCMTYSKCGEMYGPRVDPFQAQDSPRIIDQPLTYCEAENCCRLSSILRTIHHLIDYCKFFPFLAVWRSVESSQSVGIILCANCTPFRIVQGVSQLDFSRHLSLESRSNFVSTIIPLIRRDFYTAISILPSRLVQLFEYISSYPLSSLFRIR